MQRKTTRLRALIRRNKFLELPSARDPVTARLAESLGFKSVYNGGFVTGGMSGTEFVRARKQVEDLIGLEDYYRIERATVERRANVRKRKR
jgi:2-methylisocitrate lyase-like PEP mutase family enzyme